MRQSLNIGILSFHAQQNYGGVLQAFALQEVLRHTGQVLNVKVVDRWLSAGNRALVGDTNGLWRRLRLRFRGLLRLGDAAPLCRRLRTRHFVETRLLLSDDHFQDWDEFRIRQLVSPDLLIVGSDQVWHAGKWGDPRVYLLHHAPAMRAIAYAASFGMTGANLRAVEGVTTLGEWTGFARLASGETLGDIYRQGLAKFEAISCREAEGVAICAIYGREAVHVVDPVLLAGAEFWRAQVRWNRAKSRQIFCYVIGEEALTVRTPLADVCRENKMSAEIFLDGVPSWWWGPMPKNVRTLKEWWRALRRRRCDRARMRLDAGPQEFLDSIAAADWVVTDSFHALMFAIVFKRNVRVLRPRSESRRQMFARIEEFAAHATGPLIADDLDAALSSFRRGEMVAFDEPWLEARRRFSADWLTAQIEAARKAVGK